MLQIVCCRITRLL